MRSRQRTEEASRPGTEWLGNNKLLRTCLNSVLIGILPYRVTLVVMDLGWVDFHFGHSTVCLVLLGQLGIWQNRLGKMVVRDHQGHPVFTCFILQRVTNNVKNICLYTKQCINIPY